MLEEMRKQSQSAVVILLFGFIIFVFVFSFGAGSMGFRDAGCGRPSVVSVDRIAGSCHAGRPAIFPDEANWRRRTAGS